MNTASPGFEPRHQPVLAAELLQALEPRPGQVLVDATVGAGGHSRMLAERVLPAGRIIGLEQDAAMIELARPRLAAVPVTLVHANFASLRDVLNDLRIERVDGVVADLGFCSDQLEDSERGLSFQLDGPLDMRLDRSQGETAAALLKRLPERELADLFWQLGEERFSRRIARAIVERRRHEPLQTTAQLADLVCRSAPRPRSRGPRIHPATRVFQALRIAVNGELEMLESLIAQLHVCLAIGGRAAIISFHSLEDRPVKQAFRDRSRWRMLTRKPVTASDEEIDRNPRARSAKLRAAEFLGVAPTAPRSNI
jgi:16S rRNA (cytosine1402-N4)-methyltransferase